MDKYFSKGSHLPISNCTKFNTCYFDFKLYEIAKLYEIPKPYSIIQNKLRNSLAENNYYLLITIEICKALNDLFSVDRLGDLSSKKKHLEKSIIIIRPSYPDMKSNPYCLVCCFQLNRHSVKVMFMQIRFYILRSIRQ